MANGIAGAAIVCATKITHELEAAKHCSDLAGAQKYLDEALRFARLIIDESGADLK